MIFREVDDRDLVLRAREGKVEAYNALVSRWEVKVYNYLLRMTASPEDSMDLSQETFLKAYQNLQKLDEVGRFGPWLFRIAHNEAISLFRRRRPETGIEQAEVLKPAAPGMAPVELSIAVESALAQLPGDQREAVVLKVYEGFKFEEIAEILGCPASTVKSRVYTALETLKGILAPAVRAGQTGEITKGELK